MRTPWWTVVPSVAVLVAVFVLGGLAVGWWIVPAILVPGVVLISLATAYGRRQRAKSF
jgi:hypothetical protein